MLLPQLSGLYPQIKLIHVSCVLLSGSLFCLRGVLMLAGSASTNHVALRWLSYVIDTALLAAALMLLALWQQQPFPRAWLTVKLLLVCVYIVLGSFALRRAPSARARAACFAAALLVFVFLLSVARTHDPLGLLRGLT